MLCTPPALPKGCLHPAGTISWSVYCMHVLDIFWGLTAWTGTCTFTGQHKSTQKPADIPPWDSKSREEFLYRSMFNFRQVVECVCVSVFRDLFKFLHTPTVFLTHIGTHTFLKVLLKSSTSLNTLRFTNMDSLPEPNKDFLRWISFLYGMWSILDAAHSLFLRRRQLLLGRAATVKGLPPDIVALVV
jgi:hypothetical protein